MSQQEFRYKGYDITMAVKARQILVLETHLSAECVELVYKPTQEFLKENVGKMTELVCVRNPSYSYLNFKGFSADVDIVVPYKKVAHLGTITTEEQAYDLFYWYLENFKRFPHKIDALKKQGPMGIIRERIGCKIPIDSSRLNNKSLAEGVRRYMRTFVPELAELPIVWIHYREQRKISDAIWKAAKYAAIPQTDEEIREITRQDF